MTESNGTSGPSARVVHGASSSKPSEIEAGPEWAQEHARKSSQVQGASAPGASDAMSVTSERNSFEDSVRGGSGGGARVEPGEAKADVPKKAAISPQVRDEVSSAKGNGGNSREGLAAPGELVTASDGRGLNNARQDPSPSKTSTTKTQGKSRPKVKTKGAGGGEVMGDDSNETGGPAVLGPDAHVNAAHASGASPALLSAASPSATESPNLKAVSDMPGNSSRDSQSGSPDDGASPGGHDPSRPAMSTRRGATSAPSTRQSWAPGEASKPVPLSHAEPATNSGLPSAMDVDSSPDIPRRPTSASAGDALVKRRLSRSDSSDGGEVECGVPSDSPSPHKSTLDIRRLSGPSLVDDGTTVTKGAPGANYVEADLASRGAERTGREGMTKPARKRPRNEPLQGPGAKNDWPVPVPSRPGSPDSDSMDLDGGRAAALGLSKLAHVAARESIALKPALPAGREGERLAVRQRLPLEREPARGEHAGEQLPDASEAASRPCGVLSNGKREVVDGGKGGDDVGGGGGVREGRREGEHDAAGNPSDPGVAASREAPQEEASGRGVGGRLSGDEKAEAEGPGRHRSNSTLSGQESQGGTALKSDVKPDVKPDASAVKDAVVMSTAGGSNSFQSVEVRQPESGAAGEAGSRIRKESKCSPLSSKEAGALKMTNGDDGRSGSDRDSKDEGKAQTREARSRSPQKHPRNGSVDAASGDDAGGEIRHGRRRSGVTRFEPSMDPDRIRASARPERHERQAAVLASKRLLATSTSARRGGVTRLTRGGQEGSGARGRGGRGAARGGRGGRGSRGGSGVGHMREPEPESSSDEEEDDDDEDEGVGWVQCDNCEKWWTLPASVSVDDLPDTWHCRMQDWGKPPEDCFLTKEPPRAPSKPAKAGGASGASVDRDRKSSARASGRAAVVPSGGSAAVAPASGAALIAPDTPAISPAAPASPASVTIPTVAAVIEGAEDVRMTPEKATPRAAGAPVESSHPNEIQPKPEAVPAPLSEPKTEPVAQNPEQNHESTVVEPTEPPVTAAANGPPPSTLAPPAASRIPPTAPAAPAHEAIGGRGGKAHDEKPPPPQGTASRRKRRREESPEESSDEDGRGQRRDGCVAGVKASTGAAAGASSNSGAFGTDPPVEEPRSRSNSGASRWVSNCGGGGGGGGGGRGKGRKNSGSLGREAVALILEAAESRGDHTGGQAGDQAGSASRTDSVDNANTAAVVSRSPEESDRADQWVLCDHKDCGKWRRVPPGVSLDACDKW